MDLEVSPAEKAVTAELGAATGRVAALEATVAAEAFEEHTRQVE